MADQLTFYTHPMSRGRIVRWMLEEIGAPYQTEVLTYGQTMKAPDYLAINPMGKVPAVKHGDTVVTECGAILAYLADAFPDADLAPPVGTKERGPYYRWLFFGAGCIEPASTAKTMGFDPADEKKGMAGWGNLDDVTDTLEKELSSGSPYLAGDKFTAADLYISSELAWLTGFGVMEKRPAFMAYLERLNDRAAAKRANEIDDKLLADNPDLIPPQMRQG